MAPAKSKDKGKKARNAEAARAEALLAQVRALEAEAEELQSRENARKEREEKDERASYAREEHLRQLHERDDKIDSLTRRLAVLAAAQHDDRVSHERQVKQLYAQRDELLNTVSVLRATEEASRAALAREREHAHTRVTALRDEVTALRASLGSDTAELRDQLHDARMALASERERVRKATEDAAASERAAAETATALQRELTTVSTLNVALQQAVERHEADDKRNVALMQMLTVQLDENRRHFEQHLDDERTHTRRAVETVAHLESRCTQWQQEHQQAQSELATARLRADATLREYEQQLEQVKLDAAYLGSEIAAMRDECATLRRERDDAREAAERTASQHAIELEVLQKKTLEQERMLRHNETAYYDKITFMNAQVVNNRAAIAQLQQKLDDARTAHDAALAQHAREAHNIEQTLQADKQDALRRVDELHARELQLCDEVTQLKRTVAELHAKVKMREAEAEAARAVHEAEVARLRGVLDAHLLPHLAEMQVCADSAIADEAARLRDQLHSYVLDAEARVHAHGEAETWLKARIANQDDIIEALQADLRVAEQRHADEVRRYTHEIAVLRKTLDVHFIPCPM